MSMPGSFNRDSSSEVEPDPIDRLMERFDDESEGSPVLLDDDDLDLGLEDEDDEEDDEAGRELEMEEIEEVRFCHRALSLDGSEERIVNR